MFLGAEKELLVSRGNKEVYRDGNRLIKVFNEKKPAADVFNEALNVSRVQTTSIRVPEILEVSQTETGAWALATQWVEGVTLEEKLAANPDAAEDILAQFVGLQVEVASTPAPLLNRQKDKLMRMIARAEDIDPTTRYDLQMRVSGMPKSARVCHGDFNLSNVIEASDGSLYVCDWTHVTSGLPAIDAATTYLLLNIEHPNLAEAYLNAFSLAANEPKQVIRYWLPVVAAAELSRKRGQHEDFLKSWVDVTDYE